MLKRLGALASAAAIGPWAIGRDALSSSGSLSIMMWSDYLPKPFLDRFEKETGIKVRHTRYGSNEELLTKLKATKGRGFDLVSPASHRIQLWQPLELLQPWDMNRVPVSNIDRPKLDRVLPQGTWGGKPYLLPFVWAVEGLGWRADKWSRDPREASYGDLWLANHKGVIMGRTHSMMIGIGLHLDRAGKLPSNRMLDTFKNEDAMRKVWNEITRYAVDRKAWLKQFWEDSEAQINGFMQNGVILGQVTDGPITRLRNAGQPLMFAAPIEGALSWIDGLAIPIASKNLDQVYAFLNFAYNPKSGAMLANESGYQSCAAGVDKFLTKKMKRKMAEAFPGDAMERLWWWPAEPSWYGNLRARYSDIFLSA